MSLTIRPFSQLKIGEWPYLLAKVRVYHSLLDHDSLSLPVHINQTPQRPELGRADAHLALYHPVGKPLHAPRVEDDVLGLVERAAEVLLDHVRPVGLGRLHLPDDAGHHHVGRGLVLHLASADEFDDVSRRSQRLGGLELPSFAASLTN